MTCCVAWARAVPRRDLTGYRRAPPAVSRVCASARFGSWGPRASRPLGPVGVGDGGWGPQNASSRSLWTSREAGEGRRSFPEHELVGRSLETWFASRPVRGVRGPVVVARTRTAGVAPARHCRASRHLRVRRSLTIVGRCFLGHVGPPHLFADRAFARHTNHLRLPAQVA